MTLLERPRNGSDGWTGDAVCVDDATAEEAAGEIERLTAENERLRDMLSPDAILYALEHAGFVVSESELFDVCRKLGVHQQLTPHPNPPATESHEKSDKV